MVSFGRYMKVYVWSNASVRHILGMIRQREMLGQIGKVYIYMCFGCSADVMLLKQ